MAKIIIASKFLNQLSELDHKIAMLNTAKIQLIFELLALDVTSEDFDKMKHWDLILISVMDKQMAVQLNKLSAYIPNLKFVVEPEMDLFSVYPGKKSRRVWKER